MVKKIIKKICNDENYVHKNNYIKEKERCIKGRLEKMMHKADVFVFDWVSTAFTLATATNKPIVYFDLGMRNITENAQRSIRERCIVISVNDLGMKGIYDQIMLEESNSKNASFYNFCTTDNVEPRRVTLTNLIKTVLS